MGLLCTPQRACSCSPWSLRMVQMVLDLASPHFLKPSRVHGNFPSALQNTLVWRTLSNCHVQFKAWSLNKQKILTYCVHFQHSAGGTRKDFTFLTFILCITLDCYHLLEINIMPEITYILAK